ncbi:MAG: methyltransferase domain-containing protein [Tepidisphaeraceae bacterium]|jgi:phosphatidylethanolamine/phosphatidyl-N-methylethanolamine N-methyltransferase
MQESSTRIIYDFQSFFYDATFGKLVRRRIAKAVSHINVRPTDRVLDLGIGTGMALDFYPRHGRIIGVDLSRGMLRQCRKKIEQRGLVHATVLQADALHLPFADDCFDYVFISHVISVVSDPCRLITEAQRVAKPGARLVVVNHFQSTNRFIAMVEKFVCPLCTKLGWRSDLALADLIRRTGVEVDYRFKLESLDLFETVVITNNKSATSAARPALDAAALPSGQAAAVHEVAA